MRFITLFFSILSLSLIAQNNNLPEFQLTRSEVEGHIRFLASDALQGRRTGETGNNIAAGYLIAQLEAFGVKKPSSTNSYLQAVGLQEVTPVSKATMVWNKKTFTQGTNLMVLSSGGGNLNTTLVFAGHGWVDAEKGIDDYKGLDVKGKIVVTNMGTTEDKSPATVFQARSKKQKWAEERGAIGIIELFQLPTNFWGIATNYFSRPRIELKPSEAKAANNFIYGWIQEGETELSKTIKTGKKNKVNLVTNSSVIKSVASNNVIGVIEGSDPVLKNEYVLLSAHYDHVGTGKNGGGAFTPQDSIFNGTRDNAFGTVALLSAAKVLAKQTPKRSIIILAVTGEELGLLGSNFYANHPIFPLEQTIYNLNTDGAGYNSTKIITLIGLGRTGADAEIEKAAKLFGLSVNADPAPEQGLFDRSDNVSFAAKGIPAPTLSPGFTAFDEDIMKYYHQVTDNPETIDFDYLLKFCQSFSHAARLIADKAERPFWASGDKYEAVGKQLYGRK